MKTIRFWEWINGGWVKLELQDGGVIKHYQIWATDEGWSAEGDTYAREGEELRRTSISDGCDCDGRLSQTFEAAATIHHTFLHQNKPSCGLETDWQAYRRIDWQEVGASCYDQFAQAAGY